MKILLLNPPGNEVYIRDYYCSKVSKTDYIYHPTDLLYISGYLRQIGEVSVIDAIAEQINEDKCIDLINKGNFEVIIFLTGAVSWQEDRIFLKKVKSISSARLIGSGDVFMDVSADFFIENEFLDAIILDFFNPTLVNYLLGNRKKTVNILFRSKDSKIEGKVNYGHGNFEIPLPQYKLFPNNRYKYPFARRRRFATVLTDYGCPYRCQFCIINRIGFRQRTVSNVIAELEMYQKQGIKEIYFTDQTFGINKNRLTKLCNEMINRQLNLSWLCFSRVDLVDYETLKLMKKAGCHTILFGVESASQRILDHYHKDITIEQIHAAFHFCQKLGLSTVGTFIIGLPGETEADCLRTIQLSLELRCDYASFNVPVPRIGTPFRTEAIKSGWTRNKIEPMCQAYTYPVMGTESLPREKIWRLRNKAIIDFYLRPSYILHRLFMIRNYYQLETHIKGIYFMLRGMFK